MKKIILLSFLFLILSCSNDNDLSTLDDVTQIYPPLTSKISIDISSVDGFSYDSCPDFEDSSFLIKNNSILSGSIGQFGMLEESVDNSIDIFSCVRSSNGNDNFIVQRFGGIFRTTNGNTINMDAIIVINRLTQRVQGDITIYNLDNNDKIIEEFRVLGNIKKSGSCNIIG